MNKSEKVIRKYVESRQSFSWYSDIAEHSIWGFKGAPYKSFSRAIAVVKKVVSEMVSEGKVCISDCEGYQPQVFPLK